jgi:hypothetical protein
MRLEALAIGITAVLIMFIIVEFGHDCFLNQHQL